MEEDHDDINSSDDRNFEIDQDKFKAPVIWIKTTFGVSEKQIRDSISLAFANGGIEVDIIELYISNKSDKDHAYMLLSSTESSDYLLDGTISVTVKINEEEEKELSFDIADHIKPEPGQLPFTLYIWQLPKTKPANMVKEELVQLIEKWCPIIDIDLPSDRDGKGLCVGFAKIEFQYEFDTQKCIYLLNYNHFLGTKIRAAFCNRNTTKKIPSVKKPVKKPYRNRRKDTKPDRNGWVKVK